MPDPIGVAESWLLCRVARAVEVGEVPEALLTELQAEIEAAKEVSPEEARWLPSSRSWTLPVCTW